MKKEKEKTMKNFFKYTSYILVLIGALNWGLYGAFNFDLIAFLFGEMTLISRILYIIVGVSAIISMITAYICYNEHRDEY